MRECFPDGDQLAHVLNFPARIAGAQREILNSKTSDGIAKATKLAVVPYGEGELVIRRADRQASEVVVTEHYFGGTSKESRTEIRGGVLRLPLRGRGEKGSPLEWMEVNGSP